MSNRRVAKKADNQSSGELEETIRHFEDFFKSPRGKAWLSYFGLNLEEPTQTSGSEDSLEPLEHLLILEQCKIPYVLAWVNNRGFHIEGNSEKTEDPHEFATLYESVRSRSKIDTPRIRDELGIILSKMRTRAETLPLED